MVKKVIFILINVVILVFITISAFAQTLVTVKVNGQAVSFPDAKPYIDENDRTMVPVRFVSQSLGASVDWDNSSQTVIINKAADTITLKIGEKRAFKNGKEIKFDTKAVLKQDRTFVPLRFVSETLGASVDWDSKTSTVIISTSNGTDSNVGGYTVPNNITISVNGPDTNTNTDLDITVFIDRPTEPQYSQVRTILISKFDANVVNEVIDHAKQKTKRFQDIESKSFYNKGKEIYVNSGGMTVNIIVYN